MRTLSLIRIALLVFILCWVGYNQSIEKDGFGINSEVPVQKSMIRQVCYSAGKLSMLPQKSIFEKEKYKDY